ncbi:MAG: T9SS type A sorting domain-containing protein [Saprospiraceae bacterium]
MAKETFFFSEWHNSRNYTVARVTQSGGYMIVGNLNLDDGSIHDDPIFAVVTDKNGNITSEFTIDFERPVVKVFPNPATDYVNFSFSDLNGQGEEMELRIFTVNGKGVYQNKFTNSIAIPTYKGMEEKGIYFYEITYKEKQKWIGKFLVN